MKVRLSWRSRVAVWGLRCTNTLSRLSRRGSGTVAGGRVGLFLSPSLLRDLSRGRQVVLVSGTNGKTTTSAMVRVGWGDDVAGNATGANMPEGQVAALSGSSSHRVVLETDEAWLARVVEETSPEVVVLLNLSRDQLDRANEVRQMAQRWRDCLEAGNYSGVVVANAADPMVVFAAQNAANVRWVSVPAAWRSDAASCPQCTRAIVFADTWSCSCGFSQPVDPTATLKGDLVIGDERYDLHLTLPGSFNEANATLALTALSELGVDVATALERIRSLASVQGRYGVRRFAERTLRLFLAKNPAGTSALLESLEATDEVWVAINAQTADGKDPSWLYDVPFAKLAGRHVKCLGERRLDLATRLTYADVSCEVIDDIDALRTGEREVTLIANYTAFREWTARSTLC